MASFLLQLQNVPRPATTLDIRRFFIEFNIPNGGVEIYGGEYGDAFVKFNTEKDLLRARAMDKQLLLGQPVRLYLCKPSQLDDMAPRASQLQLLSHNSSQKALMPQSTKPYIDSQTDIYTRLSTENYKCPTTPAEKYASVFTERCIASPIDIYKDISTDENVGTSTVICTATAADRHSDFPTKRQTKLLTKKYRDFPSVTVSAPTKIFTGPDDEFIASKQIEIDVGREAFNNTLATGLRLPQDQAVGYVDGSPSVTKVDKIILDDLPLRRIQDTLVSKGPPKGILKTAPAIKLCEHDDIEHTRTSVPLRKKPLTATDILGMLQKAPVSAIDKDAVGIREALMAALSSSDPNPEAIALEQKKDQLPTKPTSATDVLGMIRTSEAFGKNTPTLPVPITTTAMGRPLQSQQDLRGATGSLLTKPRPSSVSLSLLTSSSDLVNTQTLQDVRNLRVIDDRIVKPTMPKDVLEMVADGLGPKQRSTLQVDLDFGATPPTKPASANDIGMPSGSSDWLMQRTQFEGDLEPRRKADGLINKPASAKDVLDLLSKSSDTLKRPQVHADSESRRITNTSNTQTSAKDILSMFLKCSDMFSQRTPVTPSSGDMPLTSTTTPITEFLPDDGNSFDSSSQRPQRAKTLIEIIDRSRKRLMPFNTDASLTVDRDLREYLPMPPTERSEDKWSAKPCADILISKPPVYQPHPQKVMEQEDLATIETSSVSTMSVETDQRASICGADLDLRTSKNKTQALSEWLTQVSSHVSWKDNDAAQGDSFREVITGKDQVRSERTQEAPKATDIKREFANWLSKMSSQEGSSAEDIKRELFMFKDIHASFDGDCGRKSDNGTDRLNEQSMESNRSKPVERDRKGGRPDDNQEAITESTSDRSGEKNGKLSQTIDNGYEQVKKTDWHRLIERSAGKVQDSGKKNDSFSNSILASTKGIGIRNRFNKNIDDEQTIEKDQDLSKVIKEQDTKCKQDASSTAVKMQDITYSLAKKRIHTGEMRKLSTPLSKPNRWDLPNNPNVVYATGLKINRFSELQDDKATQAPSEAIFSLDKRPLDNIALKGVNEPATSKIVLDVDLRQVATDKTTMPDRLPDEIGLSKPASFLSTFTEIREAKDVLTTAETLFENDIDLRQVKGTAINKPSLKHKLPKEMGLTKHLFTSVDNEIGRADSKSADDLDLRSITNDAINKPYFLNELDDDISVTDNASSTPLIGQALLDCTGLEHIDNYKVGIPVPAKAMFDDDIDFRGVKNTTMSRASYQDSKDFGNVATFPNELDHPRELTFLNSSDPKHYKTATPEKPVPVRVPPPGKPVPVMVLPPKKPVPFMVPPPETNLHATTNPDFAMGHAVDRSTFPHDLNAVSVPPTKEALQYEVCFQEPADLDGDFRALNNTVMTRPSFPDDCDLRQVKNVSTILLPRDQVSENKMEPPKGEMFPCDIDLRDIKTAAITTASFSDEIDLREVKNVTISRPRVENELNPQTRQMFPGDLDLRAVQTGYSDDTDFRKLKDVVISQASTGQTRDAGMDQMNPHNEPPFSDDVDLRGVKRPVTIKTIPTSKPSFMDMLSLFNKPATSKTQKDGTPPSSESETPVSEKFRYTTHLKQRSMNAEPIIPVYQSDRFPSGIKDIPGIKPTDLKNTETVTFDQPPKRQAIPEIRLAIINEMASPKKDYKESEDDNKTAMKRRRLTEGNGVVQDRDDRQRQGTHIKDRDMQQSHSRDRDDRQPIICDRDDRAQLRYRTSSMDGECRRNIRHSNVSQLLGDVRSEVRIESPHMEEPERDCLILREQVIGNDKDVDLVKLGEKIQGIPEGQHSDGHMNLKQTDDTKLLDVCEGNLAADDKRRLGRKQSRDKDNKNRSGRERIGERNKNKSGGERSRDKNDQSRSKKERTRDRGVKKISGRERSLDKEVTNRSGKYRSLDTDDQNRSKRERTRDRDNKNRSGKECRHKGVKNTSRREIDQDGKGRQTQNEWRSRDSDADKQIHSGKRSGERDAERQTHSEKRSRESGYKDDEQLTGSGSIDRLSGRDAGKHRSERDTSRKGNACRQRSQRVADRVKTAGKEKIQSNKVKTHNKDIIPNAKGLGTDPETRMAVDSLRDQSTIQSETPTPERLGMGTESWIAIDSWTDQNSSEALNPQGLPTDTAEHSLVGDSWIEGNKIDVNEKGTKSSAVNSCIDKIETENQDCQRSGSLSDGTDGLLRQGPESKRGWDEHLVDKQSLDRTDTGSELLTSVDSCNDLKCKLPSRSQDGVNEEPDQKSHGVGDPLIDKHKISSSRDKEENRHAKNQDEGHSAELIPVDSSLNQGGITALSRKGQKILDEENHSQKQQNTNTQTTSTVAFSTCSNEKIGNKPSPYQEYIWMMGEKQKGKSRSISTTPCIEGGNSKTPRLHSGTAMPQSEYNRRDTLRGKTHYLEHSWDPTVGGGKQQVWQNNPSGRNMHHPRGHRTNGGEHWRVEPVRVNSQVMGNRVTPGYQPLNAPEACYIDNVPGTDYIENEDFLSDTPPPPWRYKFH